MSAAAVFGIYHSKHHAELSVAGLLAAGFSNADISVLVPFRHNLQGASDEEHLKAADNSAAAFAARGTISGALGLLARIRVIAVPGVGPLVAAGPIVAALADVGVGGPTGGIPGALAGMGIARHRAKRYEGRIKEGGVLMFVCCDTSNEFNRAMDLMNQTGAQDLTISG
ncbi:MAG TPA: DUF3341 domain-containing protein [Paludibaculum sp.]|jgi:uncharacterized membrane protein